MRCAIDRLESVVRRIDVRRQHREPERHGIVVELAHLVGVVHDQRQVGSHECRRMMRLEIRGLIGDQRIRGGVRLVEAVARELLHQVEELRRLRSRQAVLFRPGDEDVALLRHLLGFFLPIARRSRSAPPRV